MVEVGGAVAGGVDQAAVPDHAQGAAGSGVTGVVGEHGVDADSHPAVAGGGAAGERDDQGRADEGGACFHPWKMMLAATEASTSSVTWPTGPRRVASHRADTPRQTRYRPRDGE